MKLHNGNNGNHGNNGNNGNHTPVLTTMKTGNKEYENSHNNVKIFLVRHGESAANVIIHAHKSQGQTLSAEHEQIVSTFKDPPLSPLGEEQAQLTATYLVDTVNTMKPSKVLVMASPYRRAMDTCRPFVVPGVAAGQPISYVTVNQGLREHTEKVKMLEEHESAGMSPDRTWSDFTDRVKAFADHLKNEATRCGPDTIIVVFGHSLYFSCLLSYIGSNETWMPDDGTTVFKMPNCCISSIGYCGSKQKWSIYNVGYKGHLGEAATGHHVPIC